MTRTPIAALALPAAMMLAGLSIAPSPAHAQAGSYQQSCRAISTGGAQLSAECKSSDGRYRQSSIEAGKCKGDIGNQNGLLACNGATAQGGGFVSGDRGGDARNNDRGRNDDHGSDRRNDNNRNDYGRSDNGHDNRGGFGGRDDHGFGGSGGRAFHGGYAGGGGFSHARPGLILYPGPNYSGRGFEVWDDVENLRREGFNDRAASVRILFGDWKLCRNAGYGSCEHTNRSIPDLRELHIDGSVSSVERK